MKSFYDITYKDNLLLDLHLPETDSFDLFIYFHGGSLTGGTRKGVEVFASTLSKNNIATATVQYRLYPNAKYPDFIEDCAYSVRWLKDNISQYGNCEKIFVGGSSAGAYLSMMLCFDEKFLNAVDMKPTDIAGYIHDAGQPTAHFNVLKERGLDGRRLIVDETAPMFYVGMAQTYSPMLFLVSDNDMVGRYEQTLLMVKTLQDFGHDKNVFLEIMHGKHCEHSFKTDENGEGVLGNLINEFVKK